VTFIQTGQLKVKEPREGWRGRFFHSRNMTFAYYTVVAGAWIHEHSHSNDEVWNVVDGSLRSQLPVRPGWLAPDVPWSFLRTLLTQ
jgi:mannose-6-phosphate isomerase-like protein (cupin superfamily)